MAYYYYYYYFPFFVFFLKCQVGWFAYYRESPFLPIQKQTVSSLGSFLNQFSPPYITCSLKVSKKRKVTHQPKFESTQLLYFLFNKIQINQRYSTEILLSKKEKLRGPKKKRRSCNLLDGASFTRFTFSRSLFYE